MATGVKTSSSTLVDVVLNVDGRPYSCKVEPDLAKALSSPDCDPEVIRAVYEAVVHDHVAGPSSSASSEPDEPDENNNLTPSAEVHIWKESEERMLISIFQERQEEFNRMKSHDILWSSISQSLNSKNIKVSVLQVKNKWKNLKKTYKKLLIIITKVDPIILNGST